MNAKKSVNRSKYWKGALQFAKRNTDDIEVVSPYNPLLDKYFDNQVDKVSIRQIAINAVKDKQRVSDKILDNNVDYACNKTSIKEMTEKECVEVEKQIKKIFQDLVLTKNNKSYDKSRITNTIKNKVQRDKQLDNKNKWKKTNTLLSGFTEEYHYPYLNNKPKQLTSCINNDFGESFTQPSLNYCQGKFELTSINIPRKSYQLSSMNNQRNSNTKQYSINCPRNSYNSFSINNQQCRYSMNIHDNDLRTYSSYSQINTSHITGNNSGYLSEIGQLREQRYFFNSNTITNQSNSSDYDQFFINTNAFTNNEYDNEAKAEIRIWT